MKNEIDFKNLIIVLLLIALILVLNINKQDIIYHNINHNSYSTVINNSYKFRNLRYFDLLKYKENNQLIGKYKAVTAYSNNTMYISNVYSDLDSNYQDYLFLQQYINLLIDNNLLDVGQFTNIADEDVIKDYYTINIYNYFFYTKYKGTTSNITNEEYNKLAENKVINDYLNTKRGEVI